MLKLDKTHTNEERKARVESVLNDVKKAILLKKLIYNH